MADKSELVALAADIVGAYASNNSVAASDLPNLITAVQAALNSAASGEIDAPSAELKPAVPIKKSVTPDYIVCLEDGKQFKSLKRHLRARYDMSPDQYREKWSLPSNYPMVAPNYAANRSALAKEHGLGRIRAKTSDGAPTPKAKTKRGR